MDPLTIVTALFVTVFTLFYLWCKYKQTYWSRRGVFSPPANWLLGHFKDAIFLRASPPHVLGEIHRACGDHPVVGVYNLQKPFLLLRDPEIIKQILIKDFHIFPDRYFSSEKKKDVVGSANIFSIKNPRWKYLRTKLSPAFTSGKQRKLFELMVDNAQSMKSYMGSKVPEIGRVTLEARGISSKYTTDVISSLAFGIRTNSFQEPEPEFYRRSRDLFSLGLIDTLELFINFFFPNDLLGGTAFGEHEKYFRSVFWESMNEREKSGIRRGDLIDLLLELKNEKQSPDFTFEGDYLLAQSTIFFAAGLETSSVTMSFTLLELAKHPEIQEKVRQELREKMTKERLTYDQISDMTYLNQVVSETLRFYPPAPLIDRIAVQDYKIPGTDNVIEKGTVVYTVLNGLHMDPQYHPEPEKFDPERFNETRKQDMKSCTYMPFGEGPRVCIGMRTGMLQTLVGLVTILSEYEVSLNPNYKNEVSKRAIFTAPADGVRLHFKKSPVMKI